jgi:hypothetical protein
MYTSRQVALLIGFALLALPIWAADDCRSQRERRDQLARQAMQAEITKLQAIRQRLCPQLEAQASQASALSATGRPPIDLDDGAGMAWTQSLHTLRCSPPAQTAGAALRRNDHVSSGVAGESHRQGGC